MNENDRGDARRDEPAGGARFEGPQQPGGAGRDAARRRRGRRGRGGRPPMPGQPFRPAGPPVQPFRPPARPEHEDEGSAQAREVAAYERRQAQQQRGPWRGPGFRAPVGPRPMGGMRPGAPRPGGFRPGGPPRGPRPGGPPAPGGMLRPRYQDIVRRATGGPRSAAMPPPDAGEPIAGPHAVLEALRAGRVIRRIYIAQERGVRAGAVSDLLREAQERHVQVLPVDRKEVERLSPTVDHQGVVGIAEGRPGVELDELLLHLDTLTKPALVLFIDSLQDPQNFGVLLRSAEGAGVDGVVIPRHRQVGLTPAVARTSAGASEHLLIADVANLRQAIDAVKEKGIWVVGTDDSGEMEWDEVDYRGPTAVVVGGEAEGIRRLVLEGCDQVVRVPMQGQVSSLNAAAAGTVVLFEALRQRIRDAAPPAAVRRQERPAPPQVEEPVEVGDEEIATEDIALEDEELEPADQPRDEELAETEAEQPAGEPEGSGSDEVIAAELGTSGPDDAAKPALKRSTPAKRAASNTTAAKRTRKKAAD